jgi:hypothetical protein
MSWLTAKAEDFPPSESEKWNVPELKNPEIPILNSYEHQARFSVQQRLEREERKN